MPHSCRKKDCSNRCATWLDSETSVYGPSKHTLRGSNGISFSTTSGARANFVSAFLTHLAVNEKVAASTQNQVFHALVFRYRQVLKIELPQLDGIVRVPQKRRLPVVLTHEETEAI